MAHSIAFLKSILGTEFGRSAKGRCLKIQTVIILYEQHAGRPKVVISATFSGAAVTDSDELQRPVHGIDVNRGSGSDVIVIKAAVIHQDSFHTPHPYEFNFFSMHKVREKLAKVSRYGF